MTIFKTTDFKVGDIVYYKSYPTDKLCHVLELLPHEAAGLFKYHIVLSPNGQQYNGRAESTWSTSASDLATHVVAKY